MFTRALPSAFRYQRTQRRLNAVDFGRSFPAFAVVLPGVVDEKNCQAGNRQTFLVRCKRTTVPLGNQRFVSSMGFRGIEFPEAMELPVDADIGLSGRFVKGVLWRSLCHMCGPRKV